jgi:tetratricopeptide (TPR) repeat protein
MSFLKKIFGSKDPVAELRQSHQSQAWAGVLSAARRIDAEALDEETRAEVAAMEAEAGDTLARINLEEGAWAQQSGDLLRARDDFQLAHEQARSEALRERATAALAALDSGQSGAPTTAADAQERAAHAGCNSCAAPERQPTQELGDLDEESRMELLLATMPEPLAERYLTAGTAFRKAWLATQDGDDEAAAAHLDQVPVDERGPLYLYERGALAARAGRHDQACRELEAALAAERELFPAFDALTGVLAAQGRFDELFKRLKQSLTEQRFGGYCWARLAELHLRRQEFEPALAAALKALDEGIAEPGLISLCAQLLERAERFDEAEALLMRISGKGCGGGAHPLLGEFWLRRGSNLDKALEAFKGALRQERDNPRWLLRIAQTYQARGWRKEAAEQVQRLLGMADLPQELRDEVKGLADRL